MLEMGLKRDCRTLWEGRWEQGSGGEYWGASGSRCKIALPCASRQGTSRANGDAKKRDVQLTYERRTDSVDRKEGGRRQPEDVKEEEKAGGVRSKQQTVNISQGENNNPTRRGIWSYQDASVQILGGVATGPWMGLLAAP